MSATLTFWPGMHNRSITDCECPPWANTSEGGTNVAIGQSVDILARKRRYAAGHGESPVSCRTSSTASARGWQHLFKSRSSVLLSFSSNMQPLENSTTRRRSPLEASRAGNNTYSVAFTSCRTSWGASCSSPSWLSCSSGTILLRMIPIVFPSNTTT